MHSPADSILIETLVESKGTSPLNKIKSKLSNFVFCGKVSISTISRRVHNKLPSARKCKWLGKFVLRSAKLQMLDDQSSHVSYPIRSCFSITFSCVDASDNTYY